MLKYDFYRGWYSNGTIASVVLLCDCDLNFEGQTLQTLIRSVAASVNMHAMTCRPIDVSIRHRMALFCMLQSVTVMMRASIEWTDFIVADVLHRIASLWMCSRLPWPKFSMSKVWNVSVSKTVRASVKMLAMTFKEVDLHHRIASLQMLSSTKLP